MAACGLGPWLVVRASSKKKWQLTNGSTAVVVSTAKDFSCPAKMAAADGGGGGSHHPQQLHSVPRTHWQGYECRRETQADGHRPRHEPRPLARRSGGVVIRKRAQPLQLRGDRRSGCASVGLWWCN